MARLLNDEANDVTIRDAILRTYDIHSGSAGTITHEEVGDVFRKRGITVSNFSDIFDNWPRNNIISADEMRNVAFGIVGGASYHR